MFSEDDLDTMQLLRCAFDPHGSSNWGKVFDRGRVRCRAGTAAGRRCRKSRCSNDASGAGSTEEAAALLREAAADGRTVTIRGRAPSRIGAFPPPADLIVETGNLTGVVEHAASDLVVIVRPGTLLRDLQKALSLAGQQLSIDETVPGASVGGTIAANTSGPRRLAYGTVRDLLIGVTIVRPVAAIVAKAAARW